MIIATRERVMDGLDDYIERVGLLLRDLKRLRQGEHPSPSELDGATQITDWSVALRGESCLSGIVGGHPSIADGRRCRSTSLWILAPELGYARTLSRYYALHRPAFMSDNA